MDANAVTFGDDLRKGDSAPAEFKVAFEELLSRLNGLLVKRTWPRTSGRDTTPVKSLTQEIANEFWIELTNNPKKLCAQSVDGWGAVMTELCRFLNRPVEHKALESARLRIYQHFRHKVHEVCRKDYENPTPLRRWHWSLPEYKTEISATQSEIDAVVEGSGLFIPADYEPHRSGQTPPTADERDIRKFTDIVLHGVRKPVAEAALVLTAWSRLRPAPPAGVDDDSDAVERHADQASVDPIEQREIGQYAAILASRFVDSLPGALLIELRHWLRKGGGPGRPRRERKQFADSFAAFANEHCRDTREREMLFENIRFVLNVNP